MNKYSLTIFMINAICLVKIDGEQVYQCNPTLSCGCSSTPVITSRIVGGQIVQGRSWGWAVHLVANWRNLCSGVIISSSWILTAASCVESYQTSQIIIYAGSNKIGDYRQIRSPAAIHLHPNLNSLARIYNVAAIQVEPPFDMSDANISQICFPEYTRKEFPPSDAALFSIGWGPSNSYEEYVQNLQQILLYRLSNRDHLCASLMFFPRTQFCTNAETLHNGPCSGDTGSPVMMFSTAKRWILTGIVIRSVKCQMTFLPIINDKITVYLRWFRSINVTGTISVA